MGSLVLTDIDICPECGSKKLYIDSRRAELICENCFLVIADALIQPAVEHVEKEPQKSSDDRILPQLFFGKTDPSGRPIAPNILWALRKTAQTYNLKSSERSVLAMENRIRRLAAQNNIPQDIVARAVNIYRYAHRQQIFKKPSLNEWARALILTACREMKYHFSVLDLATNSRSLRKVLNYHHEICRRLKISYTSLTAEDYIFYYIGKLGIHDTGVVNRAAITATLNPNVNSTPRCVGAAALYIALRNLGYDVSQKDFCQVVNLSEISLRHWVERLGGYETGEVEVPEVRKDELID